MKKLFLCMLLVLALWVVAACARDDETPEAPGVQVHEQPAQQVPAEAPAPIEGRGPENINWDEHVVYTWWLMATVNDFYTSYNDNPVVNYLQYRFNVTFDFEQPVQGTEADSLALMMGTGNFTDVIRLSQYPGSLTQLFYDGIIIDIAQWLDYMPNLSYMLETVPGFARAAKDDAGRILTLPTINDDTIHPWSGLMYRHDILEIMTGGNVQFPSGNDVPTTIADWEYMLPLFYDFFRAAGFADFAPLIIPHNGFIFFGELMNSFGAHFSYYVRDDEVRMGILEPAFFDYISTMRYWFERGWIHADFASRTGDMFFMPNPPLVFGGAAGAWFGMLMHLGDRMSMPEFGMYFDVRPMPSPMSPGISHRDMMPRAENPFGLGVTCGVYSGNPDIGRFLYIMDLFYTPEGGKLRAIGLHADQIPPGYTLMDTMGMSEGAWWFENGRVMLHPNLHEMGGDIAREVVNGIRFPGIQGMSHVNLLRDEETLHAHSMWGAQDAVSEIRPLPPQLSLTIDESTTVATNDARINDFRDQMIAMFIMGTADLTEASWAEFLAQLREFGIEENLAIHQAAFARYLARGQ